MQSLSAHGTPLTTSLAVLDARARREHRRRVVEQLGRSLELHQRPGDCEGAALTAAWLRKEAAA